MRGEVKAKPYIRRGVVPSVHLATTGEVIRNGRFVAYVLYERFLNSGIIIGRSSEDILFFFLIMSVCGGHLVAPAQPGLGQHPVEGRTGPFRPNASANNLSNVCTTSAIDCANLGL